VAAPRVFPRFAETLGSQFLAHPPIAPYVVEVSAPGHPLVAGVEPFETSDELYLCEYHGEIETLLHTRFTGEAAGFAESSWPDDAPRPVMYLHPYGDGTVLYFNLGHCRGHYDMHPVMEWWPTVDRGSWESETYWLLLRRCIAWLLEREVAA